MAAWHKKLKRQNKNFKIFSVVNLRKPYRMVLLSGRINLVGRSPLKMNDFSKSTRGILPSEHFFVSWQNGFISFMRVKYILDNFSGFFEGTPTFLTSKLYYTELAE